MEGQNIDLTRSEPSLGFQDAIDASDAAQAEREKAPEVVRADYDRSVEVPLTDAEVAGIGRDLGAKLAEIDEIEAKAKAQARVFKGQIEELQQEASGMGSAIRRGTKVEFIRCRDERILATGMMQTVRLDTGEIISERALSFDERQPNLPGVNMAPAVEANAVEAAPEPEPSNNDGLDGDEPAEGAEITSPESLANLADEGEVTNGKKRSRRRS